MKLIRILLWITILLAAPLAQAQVAATTDQNPANATKPAANDVEPAPLVFWNRRIAVLRSRLNQFTPAERVARAQERLASLPDRATEWNVTGAPATVGEYSGVMISVNEHYIFAILPGDLDVDSQETLEVAVNNATTQLRAAVEARAQQRNLPALLRAIVLSLAATVLLVFAIWLVARAALRVKARLEQKADVSAERFGLARPHLQPLLHSITRTFAKLTAWTTAIVLVYIWLTFVLLRFPYTQPWGQQLGTFLLSTLVTLGMGIVQSIPGMFTVVIIFLLTRVVVRLVIGIFGEVEKGDLALPWLHSDTARATRYLVVALIWIFAITVAYPYVPGSSTDAFKGVSVLVGLMISLGSAGLVNQVMSGLVVVYSRALKPGEFVQIGDNLGTVSDVGMLSTKLLTRKKEEITIPNAVLVGEKTVNYSRHSAAGAAQLSTMITIGYDAPWRQVHELLLHAAHKTTGVRRDPAPRVWQRALANFYVEYELVMNVDHPEQRIATLSELHMHIQDAFNEASVQIMSPAFESQPEQKVLVPKSQWFPEKVTADSNGE